MRVAESNPAGDTARWIDKLAIQELIVRYSDAATRGSWDEFESLWVKDAVWETAAPINDKTVGARAIRDQVMRNLEGEDFLVQMTHGSVITLQGEDRASATTTMHAIARRGDVHAVTNYGVYFDDLVKVDGDWKFAKRRLQPIYLESDPLPGVAPISRDQLAALDQVTGVGRGARRPESDVEREGRLRGQITNKGDCDGSQV